ncbi:S ribonuclease [Pyrus ussuriensis x Pyrus communis]|uniref:S ribonuclease n=1 Tax=Pyrus ussuriensis x Pyrus communis TaxID=2448454 RepID=A0A5N5HWK7_9ROSA|nr:S ribonuclease [Pyrus ussuriensis x Pyrus communis]
MKRVAIRNKGVQSQIGNIFVVVNRGVPSLLFAIPPSGGWGTDEGEADADEWWTPVEIAGGGRGFPSLRRLRSHHCIEFRVSKSVSFAILVFGEDKGALVEVVKERRWRRTLPTLLWEVGSKMGLFDSKAWGLKITKQRLGLYSMRKIGSWWWSDIDGEWRWICHLSRLGASGRRRRR